MFVDDTYPKVTPNPVDYQYVSHREEFTSPAFLPLTQPNSKMRFLLKVESRNITGSIQDRAMRWAIGLDRFAELNSEKKRLEFSGSAWEVVAFAAACSRAGVPASVAAYGPGALLAHHEAWLYGALIQEIGLDLETNNVVSGLNQLRIQALGKIVNEIEAELAGQELLALIWPAGDQLLDKAMSSARTQSGLRLPKQIRVGYSPTTEAAADVWVTKEETLKQVLEVARATGFSVSPPTGAAIHAAKQWLRSAVTRDLDGAVVVLDTIHPRFFDWAWPHLDLGSEGNKLGGLITPR